MARRHCSAGAWRARPSTKLVAGRHRHPIPRRRRPAQRDAWRGELGACRHGEKIDAALPKVKNPETWAHLRDLRGRSGAGVEPSRRARAPHDQPIPPLVNSARYARYQFNEAGLRARRVISGPRALPGGRGPAATTMGLAGEWLMIVWPRTPSQRVFRSPGRPQPGPNPAENSSNPTRSIRNAGNRSPLRRSVSGGSGQDRKPRGRAQLSAQCRGDQRGRRGDLDVHHRLRQRQGLPHRGRRKGDHSQQPGARASTSGSWPWSTMHPAPPPS